MSAKIITTSNGKGGTGKTTLNMYMSETLYKYGKRVLLIDLDPNCGMSEIYGKELLDETSKQLLSGKAAVPYRLREQSGDAVLDIIPSDLDINMLSNVMDTQLKIMLKKNGLIDQYDYIIIDPPGTWNAQTRNAVFASDIVIIAGTNSKLDFRATVKYFELLSNCCLESDVFVVCNKYSTKTNLDGIWEEYQKQFGEYLIEFPVPDIKSLKRISADPDYLLHPSVQKRLEKIVDIVTGTAWSKSGKENADA